MVHRLIRNYTLLKVRRLCHKGEYDRARSITRDLISEQPQSIGYNMLLADVELFARELKQAKKQYAFTKEILERDPPSSKDDNAYYTGYLNFRMDAIESHFSGKKLPPWGDFADLMNELKTKRMIRALFRFP